MDKHKEIVYFSLKSESLLSDFGNHTLWSVRQAILNLLEIVESISEPDTVDSMICDTKATLRRFIAAVIHEDGEYDDAELKLVADLFDLSRSEEVCGQQVLNNLVNEWNALSKEVPIFFRRAVESRCFREVLIEIQFIGNNVGISDDSFDTRERILVMSFVSFLEDWALDG